MHEHGIRGVTSNPTIFEKAMAAGTDYDEQLREVTATGASTEDAYWDLVPDRHRARRRRVAARVRPARGRRRLRLGRGRRRSSPTIPRAPIAQAKELWAASDRPNVMIKIPATRRRRPGDHGDARGRHQRQRHVDLQPRALPRGHRRVPRRSRAACAAGGDIHRLASVASFFVSRVDTETDRRLPEGSPLRGKAAVANAKLAYQMFRRRVAGPRWDKLASRGRAMQRPLWASTSTKNPAYSPTLYVDDADRRRHGEHARAGVGRRAGEGDGNLHADSQCSKTSTARGTSIADLRGRRRLRRRHRDAGTRRRRFVREVVPRRARHAREEGRGAQVGGSWTARRWSAKSAGLACAFNPLVFGITYTARPPNRSACQPSAAACRPRCDSR